MTFEFFLFLKSKNAVRITKLKPLRGSDIPRTIEHVQRKKIKLVDTAIESLNERFPKGELCSNFFIFDPKQTPSTKEQLKTYGDKEIETLGGYFGENQLIYKSSNEEAEFFGEMVCPKLIDAS